MMNHHLKNPALRSIATVGADQQLESVMQLEYFVCEQTKYARGLQPLGRLCVFTDWRLPGPAHNQTMAVAIYSVTIGCHHHL